MQDAESWKRYPYRPDWGDPRWFRFPHIDGHDPELGMATYYMHGFLRGRESGKLFAFMTIFTDMKVLRRMARFSFNAFALFDGETGDYGTYTDFDFPPRIFRKPKLEARNGHLAIRYAAREGLNRWESRRDEARDLVPFAWDLELAGRDQNGRRMHLALEVRADRPPAPVGGLQLGGEIMFLGGEETYSYFQSGLRMKGRLAWEGHEEDVEGDTGWIDRQWAVKDFTVHQDLRNSRYRHEWRVLQLDNGWDMSCFLQYHRHRDAARVPFSGITAQGPGPDFEVRATTRVEVRALDFVKSPGTVRSHFMITKGPRWFPHRYRMLVPEWEMDIVSEPLVNAPAHRLPIEYWTGPVRLEGTMFGRSIKGKGFDERSRPHVRDFELVDVLRALLAAAGDVDEPDQALLDYRLSEVRALALRGDAKAERSFLQRRVEPLLARIPHRTREKLQPVLRDLRAVLGARRRFL